MMPLNALTKYRTKSANVNAKKAGLDPNAIYISPTSVTEQAFYEAKHMQQQYGEEKRICLCDYKTGQHPVYVDTVNDWGEAEALLAKYDSIYAKANSMLANTATFNRSLNMAMSNPYGNGFNDLEQILNVQNTLQTGAEKDLKQQTQSIMDPLMSARHSSKKMQKQKQANRMLNDIEKSCTAGTEFVEAYDKCYTKRSRNLTKTLNSEIASSKSPYNTIKEARLICEQQLRERNVEISSNETGRQYLKAANVQDKDKKGFDQNTVCLSVKDAKASKKDWENTFQEAKDLQKKHPNERVCICDETTGNRPLYIDTVKSSKDAKDLLNRYDAMHNQAKYLMANYKQFDQALNKTMSDPTKSRMTDMQNVLKVQRAIQGNPNKLDASTSTIMRSLISDSEKTFNSEARGRANEMLALIEDSCTSGKAFVKAWETYDGNERTYNNDFNYVFDAYKKSNAKGKIKPIKTDDIQKPSKEEMYEYC